jgi:hypothetical protein
VYALAIEVLQRVAPVVEDLVPAVVVGPAVRDTDACVIRSGSPDRKLSTLEICQPPRTLPTTSFRSAQPGDFVNERAR